MSPKVAVVVRTKNRPVLLARALRSILEQTLTDLTVVVVNDGGDPQQVVDTVAAVGAAADQRFVLVHNETSQGRTQAINIGVDAADSDYLVLHDDDDSWDPRFLAATVAHLDEHPEEGAVGVRSEIVFEELDGDTITELRREVLARDLVHASLIEMAAQNYIPPIAMLIRRSAAVEAGPFDPSLPVLEDWDFLLRLLSRYPMGFLPEEPLAFWHHRQSATGEDANSVVAEAAGHDYFDLVIRDRYLRRDLAGQGSGLGHQLAMAHYLRRLPAERRAASDAMAGVADKWGHGHQEHLEVSTTRTSLEVGRLRGEVLALREVVLRLNQTVAALEAKVSPPPVKTGPVDEG